MGCRRCRRCQQTYKYGDLFENRTRSEFSEGLAFYGLLPIGRLTHNVHLLYTCQIADGLSLTSPPTPRPRRKYL